ncbi:hypothetical protein H7S55_05380 [Priestia aryabhattai]|uniref:hypothetical protein n=1 Tax=Priestia aryabhattai TaxID=412384 RepID=UPI001C8D3CE3|nr:hypothetical protein [Priestia aryabhattai]MBX9999587.1 hypothetical protein [Priestia aryabhattai]
MQVRDNDEKKEESKNNKLSLIQDTALIVSVLTGICYVMVFSFRKGVRDYYGITDLASNEVSISSIFQSINEMQRGILFVACVYVLLYLLIKIYAPVINIMLILVNIVYRKTTISSYSKKKVYSYNGKRKGFELFSKGERTNITKALAKICSHFVFILAIMVVLPVVFLEDSFVEAFHKTVTPLYYLLIGLPPVVYLFSKCFKKEDDFRDIINITNPFYYLWKKSNMSMRIAIIFIISSLLSLCFYSYGQKFAGEKKEYLMVNFNGHNSIVLENNQDQIIVASLDIKSKKVSDNFSIINGESTKDNFLKFSKIKFKHGIVVSK